MFKQLSFKSIFISIFILISTLIISDLLLNIRTESLINKEYSDIANEIKTTTKEYIDAKSDSILFIALSLANDPQYIDAIKKSSMIDFHLDTFSKKLQENTGYKHIWIQVSNQNAISIYRSWTKKRGDDLTKVRKDMVQMLKDPKIKSTISVGLFDMAFKAMVPMFDNGKYMGTIDVVAKFNSIAKQLDSIGFEPVILVDKSYKKQIKKPFTKMFLDDYYIANLNATQSNQKYIKQYGIEKLIKDKSDYIIDKEKNKFITIYKQKDVLGKDMGYFVLFYPLDKIDLGYISFYHNSILVFIFLLVIGIFLVILLINFKHYKEKTELKNMLLSKEVEEQKSELVYQANYDSLTLLPNRVLFADRLKRSIKSAQRYKNHVALLFIDLDHFKEINDSLGHEAGDHILKETAKRLQSNIRKSDTVSRLGGDEFTMILEAIHNIDEVVDIVQKILSNLQQPYQYKNNKLYSGASIGISIYPENGDNAQELLRNADAAMYKAKENGRNTYSFYTESMTKKAYERIVIETKLREAIKNNEFVVYYQPQVDIKLKTIVGFEALVRWVDYDGSIVPPFKFIPISEQTGLIIDIGKIILESVFLQTTKWENENKGFKKIAINISTKQLKDPEFIPTVKELLIKTKCNPELIEFEITESFFIDDIDEAIDILNEIKKMNIIISLDDFGTGFSSLSYLKLLPISKLKIDKSFIDDIFTDENDKTITKSIINLSKNMGLDVIAEGVETKEQEDFLKENGCILAQGYLYSKPIPVEEISKLKI